VLTTEGHEGKVYELSGDVAWTQDDLAAAISQVTGTRVVYTSVDTKQHAAILKSAGLDDGAIGFVTALDSNIKNGTLAETSGELSKLIGRPTTPLAQGLAAAL
jgi:NAD(P)H dehydrogenase (quinone)